MNDRDRYIRYLSALREYILSNPEELDQVVKKSYINNRWFTPENTQFSLASIANEMLDADKLRAWVSQYPEIVAPKSIALIPAGNLPLVGFHDFLCIYITGHHAQVKLSEKDPYLLPHLCEVLSRFDPTIKERIQFQDRLKDFDASIATGSDNSSRYFEYYFGKKPLIIRKNRFSAAVLTGEETADDLKRLASDVFRYFGMGCRNVSRLIVPAGYDFTPLLSTFDLHSDVLEHEKYKNNFDYNLSLLLLNKVKFLVNDCVMVTTEPAYQGRISCLFYREYADQADRDAMLAEWEDKLQCVVSKSLPGTIAFGHTQYPSLSDYADGVDTMAFLTTEVGGRR